MPRARLPATLLPAALLPAALLLACAVAVAAVVQDQSDAGSSGRAVEARGVPLLSARRVPLLLVGPEADRRLGERLAEIDRRAPESSCLLVSEGDRVLFAARPQRSLAPASATKVLTAAAVLAATDDSAAGRDIVSRMLRESDNDAAAELLSRIGGGDRAADLLGSAGLPVEGVRIVDGSGLDRDNRATCRAIHAVLVRAPAGGAVDQGLAVAGRSGTLASRFRGTDLDGRLRAKTGSIRGVAALAGYIESLNGVTLTFVQILNDVSPEGAVFLQDELAAALVKHPDPSVADSLGPGAAP